MELRIDQKALPEPITFNYEELKAELMKQAHDYEVAVYTEDMMKQAKADRSKLNALKKALNDERLRREREWMEPFQTFKNQINEIIAIIDKPAAIIDKQVKEYEERVKAEKKASIQEYFDTEVTHPEWLSLEKIFDSRWLNASMSMAKVKEAITDAMAKVINDCLVIDSLPEFAFEAKEIYKESLDLGRAMAEGKRLADIQRKKKQEEEMKQLLAEKVRGGPSATEEEIKAYEEQTKNDNAALKKSEIDGIKRWWVNIRACVTLEQGKEIQGYFEANGIEYTATTER